MSADFDKAIDRAVGEMLDVEPASGLRQRVIERLPASSFKPRAAGFRLPASAWIFGTVAAAAVLMLVILLPRSTPPTPDATTVSAPPAANPSAVQAPRLELRTAQVSAQSGQPTRRVVAAVAASADAAAFDTPPAPGFPQLPALSIPELSVASIQRVAPVEGPGAIATDPIATPSPLAIEPLPAQGRQ